MTREAPKALTFGVNPLKWSKMEKCEVCGGGVEAGDWPFCKGNPQDHVRE
jgi:hypothetical protein